MFAPQSLERELKERTVAKESLVSEKQQLNEEKDEQFRLKTNLEFDVSDLRDSEKNDRESRVSQIQHALITRGSFVLLLCTFVQCRIQSIVSWLTWRR